jgi:hypothetical protein
MTPVIHPFLQLTLKPFGSKVPTSRSYSQQAWQISLETACPPGVSDLLIRHARSIHAETLESPPKTPQVRHRPLLAFLRIQRFSAAAEHHTAVGRVSNPI